jgi:hypothetical protein
VSKNKEKYVVDIISHARFVRRKEYNILLSIDHIDGEIISILDALEKEGWDDVGLVPGDPFGNPMDDEEVRGWKGGQPHTMTLVTMVYQASWGAQWPEFPPSIRKAVEKLPPHSKVISLFSHLIDNEHCTIYSQEADNSEGTAGKRKDHTSSEDS